MSHHVEIKFEDRFEGICKTVLSGVANHLHTVDLGMPVCNEAFDSLARANGRTDFFIIGTNLIGDLIAVSGFTPKSLDGNRYHIGVYDSAFGELPVFESPFPGWSFRLAASTLDIDIRSRVGLVTQRLEVKEHQLTDSEKRVAEQMAKFYVQWDRELSNQPTRLRLAVEALIAEEKLRQLNERKDILKRLGEALADTLPSDEEMMRRSPSFVSLVQRPEDKSKKP